MIEKEFKTFNEAFDFCREKNYPVTVRIQKERWKLYPSGKAEPKKSSPSEGKLGKTKHTSDMLKLDTHIIGNSFDPVKIIADLIQYQRLSAKMYRENLGRK